MTERVIVRVKCSYQAVASGSCTLDFVVMNSRTEQITVHLPQTQDQTQALARIEPTLTGSQPLARLYLNSSLLDSNLVLRCLWGIVMAIDIHQWKKNFTHVPERIVAVGRIL